MQQDDQTNTSMIRNEATNVIENTNDQDNIINNEEQFDFFNDEKPSTPVDLQLEPFQLSTSNPTTDPTTHFDNESEDSNLNYRLDAKFEAPTATAKAAEDARSNFANEIISAEEPLTEDATNVALMYEKSETTFMQRKMMALAKEAADSFGDHSMKLKKSYSRVEREKKEVERQRILSKNKENGELLGKKREKTNDDFGMSLEALMGQAKKGKPRVQQDKERFLAQQQVLKEKALRAKNNKDVFLKIDTVF